jgi:hypothetical protein
VFSPLSASAAWPASANRAAPIPTSHVVRFM